MFRHFSVFVVIACKSGCICKRKLRAQFM